MEPREIAAQLSRNLEGRTLPWIDDQAGEPYALVAKMDLREVAKSLKQDQALAFDTLMSLSGVHQLGEPEHLEVVYHLYSLVHRHRFTMKVRMERLPILPARLAPPDYHLNLDSVADLWAAAGWMEREIYDLLGIHFTGHRDLRRLLLPHDWQGHPLLKDYREPDDYQGITTTRETMEQPGLEEPVSREEA